ncbi:MAG: GWxTD domain-containing protein [Luteibaculaceae bacterium]
MKKLFSITLLSLCALATFGNNIKVTFDYNLFYAQPKKAQLETFLQFDIETVHFKSMEDGNVFSKIEILKIISDENGNIVDYSKVNLSSSFNPDSISPDDFLHRSAFLLDAGTYLLELEIKDLNNAKDVSFKHKENITIKEQDSKKLSFGNPILIAGNQQDEKTGESFFAPKLISHYSNSQNILSYYVELYNGDKILNNEAFLLYHAIFDAKTNTVVEDLQLLKKASPKGFRTPINSAFNISMLGSGTYYLKVEARNRENIALASVRKDFTRTKVSKLEFSDPSLNISATFVDREVNQDSLEFFIRSFSPIADESERNFINNYVGKYDDKEVLKRFFYSFWFNRNNNNPARAWAQYKSDVELVNREYGTRIKQGWQTDRGRVHLIYGPPSVIVDRPNDYEVYPYQIWHYVKANQFSNKRFVFFNQDLVTNDYELLHSDVPGEVRNQRWNMFLHQRNQTLRDIDQTAPNTAASRIIEDFYLNPR